MFKCNEDKPKCEYCLHTGRDCEYPEVVVRQRSPAAKSEVPSPRVQTILNANWHNLRISKFEYRLLHFFQSACVPLFSFNVNMEIDHVWRTHVPKLWQSSSLVRQSIFLFSALNLWPLCNNSEKLDLLEIGPDALYDYLDYDSSQSTLTKLLGDVSLYDSSDSNKTMQKVDKSENLFTKTTKYFMNSLAETSQVLSKAETFLTGGQENEVTSSLSNDKLVFKSAELVISGILIFSFLGLHPHRLVPLIHFPDEREGEELADLLGICTGIYETIKTSSSHMLCSEFRGIFVNSEDEVVLGQDHQSCPIVNKLRSKLDEWILLNGYDTSFNAVSSEEINVFKRSINVLEICLHRCIHQNYPIPLFRWLLATECSFGELSRSKNQFALKLLYYYASMCIICRFLLFKTSTIWLDYVLWYKDYNFNMYGTWLDSDDENFYDLVVTKGYEFTDLKEYHLIGKLDPDNLTPL